MIEMDNDNIDFQNYIKAQLDDLNPVYEESHWNDLKRIMVENDDAVWYKKFLNSKTYLFSIGFILIGLASWFLLNTSEKKEILFSERLSPREVPALSMPNVQSLSSTPPEEQARLEINHNSEVGIKSPSKRTQTFNARPPKTLGHQLPSKSSEPEALQNKPIDAYNRIEARPKIGFDSLYRYFKESLKYPGELRKDSVVGKVYLSFFIDRKGAVDKVKIKKGLHELLDREALRIVKEMPRWHPTTINGKAVSSAFTLPIMFNIEVQEFEK